MHGVVVIVDFKCTLSLLVCTGDGGSSGVGELVAGDRVVLSDVFFTVCTVIFNCVQLCSLCVVYETWAGSLLAQVTSVGIVNTGGTLVHQ